MTVGYRALGVPDPQQGAESPVHVLGTTAPEAPVTTERFGPYTIEVARDTPMLDGPLVVVSHGTGGTPRPYRGLALPRERGLHRRARRAPRRSARVLARSTARSTRPRCSPTSSGSSDPDRP